MVPEIGASPAPPAPAVASRSLSRAIVFEKYSERSRRVVFFARTEASQLGARAIEPEHLLLAVMKEDASLMENTLRGHPASASEIRKTIEGTMRSDTRATDSVDLPLSATAKKVLRLATDQAEKAGDQRIEPRHLLLGILLDEES